MRRSWMSRYFMFIFSPVERISKVCILLHYWHLSYIKQRNGVRNPHMGWGGGPKTQSATQLPCERMLPTSEAVERIDDDWYYHFFKEISPRRREAREEEIDEPVSLVTELLNQQITATRKNIIIRILRVLCDFAVRNGVWRFQIPGPRSRFFWASYSFFSDSASGSDYYFKRNEAENQLVLFTLDENTQAEDNLQDVLDLFGDDINFIKTIVDDPKKEELKQELGITSYPTFLINNQLKLGGIQPPETIKNKFCELNSLDQCSTTLSTALKAASS